MDSWIVYGGFVLVALLVMALGVVSTYPLASRENRIAQMCNGSVSVTFHADTASSTALSNITTGARVVPGATITGAGIPANTHIVSYDFAAHTAVLSQAATATASAVLMTQVNPLDGGFNNKNFRLFKSAFTVQVNTLLSDLTAIEADYDGYAAQPVTMSLGFVDPNNNAVAQSQLLTFAPTGSVTSNQIFGWWIDDGVNVLMGGSLVAPVTLDGPTKELSVVLQDSFPPATGLIQVVP
jgi:hypothetical protein